jgi:recombination protein RecT
MTEKNKNSNTQLSVVDSITIGLQKGYEKSIANYFQSDNKKVLKFFSSVKYCLSTTPKLKECTRESLFEAFMDCAQFELYPSNISGEAYILPSLNTKKIVDENGKEKYIKVLEARFQLGYQGINTLLYRAGTKNIIPDVIYKNDIFEYESGLEPKLIHKPNIFGDRGEAIGAYAIAVLPSGEKQFKVLSKADIMKFKEFSKSKDSEYSAWQPKNDPELSMWKKTVLKQLSKFLPKNETILKAIELDNKDSRINEAKDLLENSKLKVGDLLLNNQQNEKDENTNPEENKEDTNTKDSKVN